jgi:hypothetical protein
MPKLRLFSFMVFGLLIASASASAAAATTSVFEWSLLHAGPAASSAASRNAHKGNEFGISCLATFHTENTGRMPGEGFSVTSCKPVKRQGAHGHWRVVSDPDETWAMPDNRPVFVQSDDTLLASEDESSTSLDM